MGDGCIRIMNKVRQIFSVNKAANGSSGPLILEGRCLDVGYVWISAQGSRA